MSSNKNANGLVALLVMAGVAVGLYLAIGMKKSQSYFAQIVTKMGGSNDYSFLLSADYDYVKNWAKALKDGEKEFEFNGKKYYTSGGKAVA